MDDSGLVRPGEPVGDLHGEIEKLLHRERSGREQIAERLALHELHRDVGQRIGAADLVDGDDVRMVEGRHRARFFLEASDAIGLGGHLLGQDLERHVAVQPRVARPVDVAHPAGAQPSADRVYAELATREIAPRDLSPPAAQRLRVDSVDTPPT